MLSFIFLFPRGGGCSILKEKGGLFFRKEKRKSIPSREEGGFD